MKKPPIFWCQEERTLVKFCFGISEHVYQRKPFDKHSNIKCFKNTNGKFGFEKHENMIHSSFSFLHVNCVSIFMKERLNQPYLSI